MACFRCELGYHAAKFTHSRKSNQFRRVFLGKGFHGKFWRMETKRWNSRDRLNTKLFGIWLPQALGLVERFKQVFCFQNTDACCVSNFWIKVMQYWFLEIHKQMTCVSFFLFPFLALKLNSEQLYPIHKTDQSSMIDCLVSRTPY